MSALHDLPLTVAGRPARPSGVSAPLMDVALLSRSQGASAGGPAPRPSLAAHAHPEPTHPEQPGRDTLREDALLWREITEEIERGENESMASAAGRRGALGVCWLAGSGGAGMIRTLFDVMRVDPEPLAVMLLCSLLAVFIITVEISVAANAPCRDYVLRWGSECHRGTTLEITAAGFLCVCPVVDEP